MIRSLKLICSECQQPFACEGDLYYKDDFSSTAIGDAKLICPSCLAKWQQYWQVKSAHFKEVDYNYYVDLELVNGDSYEDMDCTAIPEYEIVTTGQDLPESEQHKLYAIYAAWDAERKQHVLKDCFFSDAFMRTTFTCETYGGERYEEVAFRFNMQGVFETERPVPDYIREQIITAWRQYQAQNS